MDILQWHPEIRRVSELKAWDKNPRLISEKAFEKLKERITKRGFHDVIKIDLNNVVLSGNQRKTALLQLGVSEVNCLVPNRQPTAEESDQIAIESNLSDGSFDAELLAGFDMDLLKDTITDDKLLSRVQRAKSGKDSLNDAPPANTGGPCRVNLGDVWLLGKHRVMCGDATNSANVGQLMGEQKADMIFTDPPYNVDYTGGTKDRLKIMNDKMDGNEFYKFLLAAFQNYAQNLKRGGAIYVCHADTEGLNFRAAFVSAGFALKQTIIWVKNHFVLGRQDYQWKHEPILYGWLDGENHIFYGDRSETTVWQIDKPLVSNDHPTMKPVELIVKALTNSSKMDDIILDFFGGSGSTLIACEQTNRICFTMDLDPKYCEVIISRWEKLTGLTAVRHE